MKGEAKRYQRSLLYSTSAWIFVLGTIHPTMVSAQDSSAAASNIIADIVVTARKREESLMEIPESIVAISQEALERGNIKTLDDIGYAVPNLSLSVRTDGVPNASIRGVGSFGNTQGVGFYLDDIQLFSDASARFGDVERIEVLKGPQGTLYGGSNIGGALRFVAVRPDSKEFSGRIKGTVGEQNIREVEATLNIPLSETWAVRLFGFTTSDDGFLENLNPPRVNGGVGNNDKDIGKSSESGIRIAVAGELAPNFDLYASFRWNDLDAPNNPWGLELDNNFEYSNQRNFSFNPRLYRETIAGTLELNYDFGPAALTSLTSYTDTSFEENMDLDISPEFVVGVHRPKEYKIFTQELRLTSDNSSPFEWLAGLYHLRYEEDTDATLLLHESGDILGIGGIPTALEEQNILVLPFEDRLRDRKQYAAFATASYRFGGLEIGGGIRVDHWKVYTINRDSQFDGTQSKTEILPRISVAYYLDNMDANIYASVSRGFEPGGFNLTNFAGANELFGYGAEKTTNYELGFKGQSDDRRFMFTAAVFYIDYKDRQFELQTTGPDGNIVEGILNAGNSRQYGAEFDINWRATDNLTLAVSGGIVEAEWKKGTILDDGLDISGLRPPYMKAKTLVASADYNQPLSNDWVLQGRVQVSYSGKFQVDLANEYQNPSYTLVNARLGVARNNLEIALNVENLFNKNHYTDATLFPNFNPLIAQPGIVIGTLGQPRVITGSMSLKF